MPLANGGGGGFNLFYTLWPRYGSDKSGAPPRQRQTDCAHGMQAWTRDEFEFPNFLSQIFETEGALENFAVISLRFLP